MKRDLKIIFMGTPEFAVETLKLLVEQKYNVVGVITAADKPAGRGQKIHESDVKKYAISQNLTVLQPTNLKDDRFLQELKRLEANLQIVVAFRMLPEAVWNMPAYGTFNLHASLLPDYRGAAPIHWAIINGEHTTGATTFFIDDKIDTGAIILQEEVSIADDETVGSLHDRLMTAGSKLVLKTVELIEEGTVTTAVQPATIYKKTAYKLNKDNCKIDWELDTITIYNKIRGLNPFPAAWCYLKNGDETLAIKIFESERLIEHTSDSAGTIELTSEALKVTTKDGYIIVKELQLPGKRKMDVKSLLNGYKMSKDAKML